MAKRKAEMAFMPSTPKRAQIPCLPSTPKPSTPQRIVLSIEEKRDVLKRFDALSNMSQEGASKMLQIPRMTLRRILKNREEIMSAPNSAKKRCRVGKDEVVERALISWFHNVRDKNAPISQEIMLVQAERLAKKLGHDEFKSSRGWLHRLCKREEIKFKKLHGEGASSDFEARDKWLTDTWPNLRKKYEGKDIWNTDETGLFYRDAQKGYPKSHRGCSWEKS